MLFGSAFHYAIRTLLVLTRREPRFVPVRELAASLGLPRPFLGKVVNRLAKSGLVETSKGRLGGVRLARAPHIITLEDVIVSFHHDLDPGECLLGLPECGPASPCPVHGPYRSFRSMFHSTIRSRTLSEVAADFEAHGSPSGREDSTTSDAGTRDFTDERELPDA